MADVKISALPASTTPLAGTEVLPIVQSGVTKQVSVANLTAGRAVSASTVTATDLKTSPTTANLDISGTTIAAGGTDSNIDVNINAKGTGIAYLNQKWGVNTSGTLVPASGNTYDIGNGLSNPRDVNVDRYVVLNGATASKAVFTDASKNLTTTGTVGIAQGGTNQTTFTGKSGNIAGLIYYDGTSLANDTTVTDEGYDTTNNNLVSRGYALSSNGIITESTTARTLSAADNGKVIYCTNGSATTITTAASLGAGFSCTIVQGGAGKVTVAQGASTTLVSYSSLFSTMGQYAVISLIAPVANTFIAAGNLGV